MNTNTTEYKSSILKKIDDGIKLAMENLAKAFRARYEDDAATTVRLGALKLIKSELIRKNGELHSNVEYKMNENEETKVLLKMASDHEEAMKGYKQADNMDAYNQEEAELEVIEEYTPKQPTEEDIADYTKEVIAEYLASKPNDYEVSMRDMGQIMPKVKEKFPNVNGNIVKNILLN